MESLGIGFNLMYCIAFIVVIALIFVILEFNRFVKLKNKVKQSKASIDIYLNQRFDLIPNLVECVKGYAKYEQETYEKIAKLRTNYDKNKDEESASKLNGVCNDLIAVGESNPDLKANEQFLNLQKNIAKTENQIQAARRLYNGDVTLYNTLVLTFPNNIFAKMFGFKEEKLFEVEIEKTKNVIIDL